jgi:hypothetical protein
MNDNRAIFVAFVLCLASSALSFSFYPTSYRTSIPSLTFKKLDHDMNDASQLEYNDDAFGLIFLGSFVVEHDNTFAATFATLSAVAAILVRQRIVIQGIPVLPGLVALTNLLVFQTPVFSNLHPESLSYLQVGSCMLSFIWSVLKSTKLNRKDG